MPELPEVETIKNQLNPLLLSEDIISVYTSDKKLRAIIPNLTALIGQKLHDITRRNKYLVLKFDTHFLVIHLGMTGQIIINGNPDDKHVHMNLQMSEHRLIYKDPRRFGIILLYLIQDYPEIDLLPIFKNLGYEPLQNTFTFNILKNMMENKNIPIKKFLMDSQYVCGIGNIYASEILFKSKIHPETPTKNVDIKLIKILHNNIILVLKKAISLGGSSISDFVHTNGTSGKMQNFYKVYGRNNQDCKVCGTKILKIMQGGRSTFYCPHCQIKA